MQKKIEIMPMKSTKTLLPLYTISLLFLFIACKNSRDNRSSTDRLTKSKDNSHSTVLINGKLWYSENLKVKKFKNGDTIHYANSPEDWIKYANLNKPAYTYYNFDSLNFAKIGKLYNWYAIEDVRGIAPEGWRIPEESDWASLQRYCDSAFGRNIDLDQIANTRFGTEELLDTKVWGYGNGSNKTGFSALPGGYIDDFGVFSENKFTTGWWSNSQSNNRQLLSTDAKCESCPFCFLLTIIGRDYHNVAPKGFGLYIRCVAAS